MNTSETKKVDGKWEESARLFERRAEVERIIVLLWLFVHQLGTSKQAFGASLALRNTSNTNEDFREVEFSIWKWKTNIRSVFGVFGNFSVCFGGIRPELQYQRMRFGLWIQESIGLLVTFGSLFSSGVVLQMPGR